MAEAESDVQRCDTPNSLSDTISDEMQDEIVEETISNSTFDFAERSWKTDFTLVVEGTRFYVSKIILALASPVFDRMFESDFKESTTGELELPGKKADDVNEFLLAIYPKSASVMSKKIALKVLPLAEEYQVIYLKQRCEEALLGSIDALTSIEELYQLLKEAHLYRLNDLLKTCVSFVSEKSVEEIDKTNGEIVLPEEVVRDIYQNLSRKLSVRVTELELSNVQLRDQLLTHKTWKNYFSRASGKSVNPALDRDLVWVGRTWTFTVDVKKRKPVRDSIFIWDTELEIKFDFKRNRVNAKQTYEVLSSHLKNKDKNEIECACVIQFVFVNKLPTEDHLAVKHGAIFMSHKQSDEWKLVKLDAIEDEEKGFVDEERKVQLEVNIFMSEPKQLGTVNRLGQ